VTRAALTSCVESIWRSDHRLQHSQDETARMLCDASARAPAHESLQLASITSRDTIHSVCSRRRWLHRPLTHLADMSGRRTHRSAAANHPVSLSNYPLLVAESPRLPGCCPKIWNALPDNASSSTHSGINRKRFCCFSEPSAIGTYWKL